MDSLKDLIVKYLREVADKIEVGTSDVTSSQAIEILRVVAHESLSKEQACSYLNLSRSRFDDLVREKKLPKGRKEVVWKELRWYKDELDLAVRRMKNKDIIW
jgi:predicted DNA-binding transcriptional regulator AlpA